MKLAVTYENGQVFQHFGHCENFKVYVIEGNEVQSSAILSAVGSGHGALAGFLRTHGVDTLLCGGIGGGARTALAEAGIQLYPGVTGDADASVAALLGGSLSFDPNVVCNHHGEGHVCGDHEDGHSCGDHH
ncbi:MAG: NifB/NifX family molybdenum-iron cluster-binding protein [Angelakisella sp.]